MSLDRVELPANSMWRNTPVYRTDDGTVVFGLRRMVVLQDPSDQLFVVTGPMVGRLDLISQLFYETPELWWVLAEVNNLVDPMTQVVNGLRLRVPVKARIEQQ